MTIRLLSFGSYPLPHLEVLAFETAGLQSALLYVERRNHGGYMFEVLYFAAICRILRGR